jgi:hypothetical protein
MLMARAKPRHTNRDGNRASDVIARLRALFSKKPLTLGPLDLNQAMAPGVTFSFSIPCSADDAIMSTS